MNKKKICLVIASPLTIDFFFIELIKLLAKKYELTVITNTDNSNFLNYLGVPIRVFPVLMERNVSLWRDLKALTRLIIIFYKENFDIVHTHAPKSGLLGITAAWLANINIRVHTFHGEVWVTRKGLWRLFLKLLDKWLAKRATHLLAVSSSQRDFLIEQGIVPKEKIEMLASGSICGVDSAKFRPDLSLRRDIRASLGIAEMDIVILYVGRLTEDKGLLDLVAAFFKINCHNVHLLIVGPDEENLRCLIKERYGEERIYFVDHTSTPESYMAASDMLCLPSYREGFGLVLLEAASTGLPTIGSRIYGITDAMIEFETGLLFNVGDVEDLYEKINQLVRDKELRATLGKRGRIRAHQKFSKKLLLSKTLDYYKDITSGC